MVKVGQTHRRLDAGEASRGGEPRVLPTGLGFARGLRLQRAGRLAHLVVVAAAAAVVGIDGGDQIGGGRSSGAVGFGAAAHKRGS